MLTVAEVERILLQPNILEGAGAARPRHYRDAVHDRHAASGAGESEGVGSRHRAGCGDDLPGQREKDRIIPLGDRTALWVKKYLDESRPNLVGEPEDHILFLSNAGEPLSLNYLTEMVHGYVDAADIGKRGACHLFRHTMATLMLEGGADIRYIQAMPGHADLKTTQLCTHVAIRQLQAIHRATHPAKLEREKQDIREALEAEQGDEDV